MKHVFVSQVGKAKMEKKRKVKMHRLKREEEIIPAEKQKFTAEKREERRECSILRYTKYTVLSP